VNGPYFRMQTDPQRNGLAIKRQALQSLASNTSQPTVHDHTCSALVVCEVGEGAFRRRVGLGTGSGRGPHPAMIMAHSRALALSVIPGNNRRSSMAAENSPPCSKAARIAAASASETTNIP
jgi:hypothetical protein